MKQLFVTGGTGFIGTHLVRNLSNKGYKLTLLSREKNIIKDKENQHYVIGDLLEMDSLDKSIWKNINCVVHMASDIDFYPPDPKKEEMIIYDGTKNLFTLAYQNGIRDFIYISSTEAIGVTKGMAKEDAEPKPAFLYGASKLKTEKWIKEFAETNRDFKYTIIRPAGVFGPEETNLFYQLIWGTNMGLFFVKPNPTARSQWIHVHDVVSAITAAIECEKKNSTYFISTDDFMTYGEVLEHLCKLLDRMKPFIPIPVNVLKLVVNIADPILNIHWKHPFVYKGNTIEQMKVDRHYDNSKAKKELNWRPKYTMKDGITNTVEWNLKNGLIKWPISPLAILGIFIVFMIWFLFIK